MSQYLALVLTFLKIAWRGPAATEGAKVRRGALAGGFLGYLLIGAIMMLFAVAFPEPRLGGFMLQSMSFMMVAVAFLNIYGDLVFDARDVPLLFWRPLDPRAYLAARLTAIAVYFAAVTAALNLPGAFVLAFRFGPAWYPLAHYAGALVGACAALVIALLLLFLLLKAIGRERLRDTIAWVQIAVTFLFLGGNQLLGRARFVEDLPPSGLFGGVTAFLLPMSWGQAVCDALAWRLLPGQGEVAVFGLAVPISVGGILVLLFGRSYGDVLRALGEGESRREAPSRSGVVRRGLERVLGTDPAARAGFLLSWATIRRARDYKIRAIPQFGLPVIFSLMAFLSDFTFAGAFVPAMVAVAACQGLICILGSEHAAAGWAWALAPVTDPKPALRGAALAVAGALLVPVLVLLAAGSLVAWGPVRALGFVTLSAALALAGLRWFHGSIDRFPCTMTLEEARRDAMGLQAVIAFVIALFVSALDAALVWKVGAWVSPLLAALPLAWGWRGLFARR